ncbi:MAG: DUF2510 domain-containing protein [Mycobacterium sp.]
MGEQSGYPAGWYPDPQGTQRRRYWDGQQWTDNFAEPEVVGGTRKATGAKVVAGMFVVLGLLPLALGVFGAADGGTGAGERFAVAAIGVLMMLAAWPVYAAFQYFERRRWRQEAVDRARALAINAEVENAAFLQGDDMRGIYGQYPLPPELRDDDNR